MEEPTGKHGVVHLPTHSLLGFETIRTYMVASKRGQRHVRMLQKFRLVLNN